ncbi:MAG: SBBP repeat-containing protein [Promethearchaeota archaeon]
MKKKHLKIKFLILFGVTLVLLSGPILNFNNNRMFADTISKKVIKTASPPKMEWNHTWGGIGVDVGLDVAIDLSGNAYVAGYTNSFGAVNMDICLVKFNSLGVVWNHTWGGGGDDDGTGIALDSSGNAYVAGWTNSFGTLGTDICLVKFNPTGGVEWNHTWGGSGYDYGRGIALDSSGNAYIVGSTVRVEAYNDDMCLVKFNSIGGVERNYTWGGSGDDYGTEVVLDSSGNAYVVGSTESFGAIGYDMCLVKFNTTGGVEWNYTWGGSGDDYGRGIALDSSGNAYIVGSTESFGVIGYDICLVKFNPTGGVEWNYTWGGSGDDSGSEVVLDSSGNIYVAGYTESFEALSGDMCLVKFNTTGGVEWNYTWGGSLDDSAYGMTMDSLGNIYVTGFSHNGWETGWDLRLIKFTFDTSDDGPQIPDLLFFIIIGSIIGGTGIITIIVLGIVRLRKKRT